MSLILKITKYGYAIKFSNQFWGIFTLTWTAAKNIAPHILLLMIQENQKNLLEMLLQQTSGFTSYLSSINHDWTGKTTKKRIPAPILLIGT